MSVMLDAFAVLAVLRNESASNEVEALITEGAVVSTVNVAEVLDRLCRTGTPHDEVTADFAELDADIVHPPADVTVEAGLMRARNYHHRKRAVSLADCMAAAHAIHLDVPLATADGPLIQTVRAEGGSVVLLPDTRGVRPD